MTDLIPIHVAIIRSRPRIEIDPEKIDGWFASTYTINSRRRQIREMRIWIDEFTTGRFFLHHGIIAFEDEKDFIIFKLWYKE